MPNEVATPEVVDSAFVESASTVDTVAPAETAAPVKNSRKAKNIENELTEVTQKVEKFADRATVYLSGIKVEFEKGIAKVTAEVAKALSDAGIVK